MNSITKILGSQDLLTSSGSTEPKRLMEEIVARFRMPIDVRLSKPEVAEAIARAAGVQWDASCDSRCSPSGGGSTITLEGLVRLEKAVKILDAQP